MSSSFVLCRVMMFGVGSRLAKEQFFISRFRQKKLDLKYKGKKLSLDLPIAACWWCRIWHGEKRLDWFEKFEII